MQNEIERIDSLLSPFSFSEEKKTDSMSMDTLGIITPNHFNRLFKSLTSIELEKALKKSEVTHPHYGKEPLLRINDDFFSYVSLAEAIIESKELFTGCFLGAGHGTWIGTAMAMLKQIHPQKKYQFLAVEAEPTHFQWLKEFLQLNQINLKSCQLVDKIVLDRSGYVPFIVGIPDKCYGQYCLNFEISFPMLKTYFPKKNFMIKVWNFLSSFPLKVLGVTIQWLPSICLSELLRNYEKVDIIFADIQGAEFPVFQESIKELNQKVRLMHISTHKFRLSNNYTRGTEEKLRDLFSRENWTKVYDFPNHQINSTPLGEVYFCDGLQVWRNPRFQ